MASSATAQTTTTLLEQARAGTGLLLLLAPGRTGRLAGARAWNRRSRLLLRLLGARQLVQGLLSLPPSRSGLWRGAAVDATHAASMLALGQLDRGHRHQLRSQAGVAFGWALSSGAGALTWSAR